MISKTSSDPELWSAIQEDDEKAFNVFFERHWQKVYTSVYLVTRDKTICNQIVNDIFLNLWIKRKELTITFFKSYLTTSASYHIYRYLKTQKKKNSVLSYTEESFVERWSVAGKTDDDLIYNEMNAHVENSLQVLPKRCKEIYLMSRREQLTNDEIAERLSISRRTVENQLTHALYYVRIAVKALLSFIILLKMI